ncbi:O-antigen ligase family protein [Sphingomonas floccifaciens]|uniref:O-antigen ligase family protein n=1 Tax=Sphingomonas floccifaciens TaxID=1844115 RepID=A0ABW4NGG2_9SPHN
MVSNFARQRPWPSLSLMLLGALIAVLLLAGGASRGDVSGQAVTRGASCAILIVIIAFARMGTLQTVKGPLLILSAAFVLILSHLIPLPYDMWKLLPGRTVFAEADVLGGTAQLSRPLAIAPQFAVNAISTLTVPLVVLLLMAGLDEHDRRWLLSLVLAAVTIAMVAGLLQFSGVGIDNVFVNDSPGQVSGPLANRNHFALLLAIGCLLAPTWALADKAKTGWRIPTAIGLVPLFVLTILATGSRAGMVLGVLGLGLGLLVAGGRIRTRIRRAPRWAMFALVAGIVGVIGIFVLISVAADRAVSIDRAFAMDTSQDMRSRGLPTVLAMFGTYFPTGYGFGGFDAMFRLGEPLELLKPSYFNHAHDDWLELAIDAGLPGLVLAGGAVCWWGWSTIQAWRRRANDDITMARLGSATLLLVMLASIVDYPARTPVMMAVVAIAAAWLASAQRSAEASALPQVP